MKDVLHVVTGATGRTGFPLCKELRDRGYNVRALYRKESKITRALAALGCQLMTCDVRDVESVDKAIEGAAYVYHLSAMISIESKPNEGLVETNIGGVKNVIEACVKHNVKRLVHVGSVHALEVVDGTIAEPSRYNPDVVHGFYGKSKAAACNLVLDAVAQKDLDAVIGLPSGIIGPYEYVNTNFGEMVEMVSKNKLRIGLKGSYNFVDVRDVAAALADLAEMGVKGESYLISGNCISVKEMLNIVAEAAGVKPIKFLAPLFLVKMFAPIGEKFSLKKNVKPTFTPYSIRVLQENCDFSYEKLKTLTGYEPRSVEESLSDQVKFLAIREDGESE